MRTNTSTQDLAEQIEQLVREHVTALRRLVREAVERGLTEAVEAPRQSQQRRPRAKARRSKRRPEEIAALCERLYVAVCQMPGETMAVLASKVGATPRELAVPVARLKAAERVRSVGGRSHTRYFPMVGDAKAEKEARA